jgi:hypothetical protein
VTLADAPVLKNSILKLGTIALGPSAISRESPLRDRQNRELSQKLSSLATAGPRRRRGESHVPFTLPASDTVGTNVVHPTFGDDLLTVVASALRDHLAKAADREAWR